MFSSYFGGGAHVASKLHKFSFKVIVKLVICSGILIFGPEVNSFSSLSSIHLVTFTVTIYGTGVKSSAPLRSSIFLRATAARYAVST